VQNPFHHGVSRMDDASGWFSLTGVCALNLHSVLWHCWSEQGKGIRPVKSLLRLSPFIQFLEPIQHGVNLEKSASKTNWLHVCRHGLFTDTNRSKLCLIVVGQLDADLFRSCLTSLLDSLLPARLNHWMPRSPDFLLQLMLVVLACQVWRKCLKMSNF